MDEFYDSNPVVWSKENHAAKGYKEYFDNMLKEGHKLDLEGLRTSKTNRLYVPRIYNYKAIKNGTLTPTLIRKQI